MKTAIEKMIEAVEKGYQNTILWDEWKLLMLEVEKQYLNRAFLAGQDSSFETYDEYLEYKKQEQIHKNYPQLNASREEMAEMQKHIK